MRNFAICMDIRIVFLAPVWIRMVVGGNGRAGVAGTPILSITRIRIDNEKLLGIIVA